MVPTGTELDAANSRLYVIDEVVGAYSQVFAMLRDSNAEALGLGGNHPRIQTAVTGSHAPARCVKLSYERIVQLRQLPPITAHIRA